jgi:anti-sigma factor RsiW
MELEHEEIQTMMMEALDGRLDESRRPEMMAHLRTCPLCVREWAALQAIHQLFLQVPALAPAAGFAERTLARLPNMQYRLWFLSSLYGLLLLSGVVPLVLVSLFVLQIGPALTQPAFVRSVLQAGRQVGLLLQTLWAAIVQGAAGLGDVAVQQPALIGWLLVMLGLVVLWSGVYGHLTLPRRVEEARS